VSDQRSERKDGIVRRRFLAEAARAACGAGLFGLALGLHVRQARSLPAQALRPPGAREDESFLGACVRCGLCVRDCPYDTLRLAELGDGVAVGTPYFVAREVACEMCEDIPCVAACPTAALDKTLTDIDDARIGLAVLIDQETCLNFNGLRCEVCYRACPLMGKAITIEHRPNPRTGAHGMQTPVVHSEHCTGCGKCEMTCVLDRSAIKVMPRDLATGALGEHYRFGWVEKEKLGRSVVPGAIYPPPRLPEGRR
jgi:ferredoxin-type protein NapG